MKFRIEKDSLGEVKVPQKALTFATLKPLRLLAFACCEVVVKTHSIVFVVNIVIKFCYYFIVHYFINYVAGIKLQNGI